MLTIIIIIVVVLIYCYCHYHYYYHYQHLLHPSPHVTQHCSHNLLSFLWSFYQVGLIFTIITIFIYYPPPTHPYNKNPTLPPRPKLYLFLSNVHGMSEWRGFLLCSLRWSGHPCLLFAYSWNGSRTRCLSNVCVPLFVLGIINPSHLILLFGS